jgi:type II secretory pathway predicted ATPase ExeA
MALYLEHFGIREHPFKITPTTEFFYRGGVRGEILDALLYSIQNSEGILKVSGEVGSGKTMLCRTLMENLPPEIEIVYIANPSLSGREILYNICEELRLSVDGDKAGIVRRLQDYLIERHAAGSHIVVCIDEAQAMPDESLEELRLLSNLETGRHKLLQIVLFGQPELDDKLARQQMRQLRERVVADFKLQPLSAHDVRDYISTRLRAAGYNGPQLFSDRACKLIAKISQGLSRRVNILADKSMLAAFSKNALLVGREHAKIAARDAKFAKMRYKPAGASLPWQMLVVGGGAAVLTIAIIAVILRFGEEEPPLQLAAEEQPSIAVASPPPEEEAFDEEELGEELGEEPTNTAVAIAEQLAADAAEDSPLVAFTVTPEGEIVELGEDQIYLTETSPNNSEQTDDEAQLSAAEPIIQTVVVAQTVFVTVEVEPPAQIADEAAPLAGLLRADDNPRWHAMPSNSLLRDRLNISEAWLGGELRFGEYTARLMTVPQSRAVFVERFLRDFARFYNPRLVAVYPAFIADDKQFVISYGVFKSEDATQAFIAQLPAFFKGGRPFAQPTLDSRAEAEW